MGYIKKEYRNILDIIDERPLPKDWDKFVEKESVFQNIIIKKGKECICTNCKNTFKSNKKIYEEVKCPYCKNTYKMRRSNLKSLIITDDLALLDKVNDKFILRFFELRSIYNKTKRKYDFERSCVEYARIVPDEYNAEFVNERVSKCQCHIHINHLSNCGKWRQYTRRYNFVNKEIVFPYNLKEIFKNTKYQYSMLWELVKHIRYINFEEILKVAKYSENIEFLTKLKLYNLALEADKITQRGNFEKRFGVSKEFYPFMKRNNITYSELEILQHIKRPDIRAIRHLLKNYRTYSLKELSNLISLDKLLKYEKIKKRRIDINMYVDYLENAKLLGFNLKDKKYIFPKNLKEVHDNAVEQVKKYKNEILSEAIIRRYNELSKNTFKNKEYIIIPPKSKEEFIDEASQQGNCVYTNYYEKYANGTSDIYFMRRINNTKKSLVTVEVRDNKIVQSKIKGNQRPSDKELLFLEKWQKKVLEKVC